MIRPQPDWRRARLGEVCTIVSGSTPKTSVDEYWGGDIAWATPKDLSNLEGAVISDTPRKLTQAGLASCSSAVLPAGSVLFSSRAPIGHVAINSVPMATNQGFKSFVPDDGVLDAKFLYWWLKAHRAYMEGLGNGATFKEVSKAVVEKVEVPLPPLGEQRRIAGILDAADALRAKRRESIALIDTLTQSIFLDMFGDKTRWSLRDIGSLGVVTTGRTPPTASEGMFGGTIPFVTPGDLASAKPVVRTLTEAGASASRTVASGATLVCCIGATIGKVGRAVELSAFNQQLNAIEWGSEVLPQYGLFALKRLRPEIVGRGSSTTLPLLPKGQFMRLKIPVPPLELQGEFEVCVNRIDLQSAETRIALERHDLLFASLQARAFRGQL